MELPLLKEPELHLLLVVTKTIVLAIHHGADAGRHRQQKRERLHASSHTAYSEYSIFMNSFLSAAC
jgi:hypothetical protein